MISKASLPLALGLSLVLAFAGTGCPEKGDPPLDCPQGFESATDEASGLSVCAAVLPEGECAANTRAQVGEAECVPVGNHTCAVGFATAADGWGCEPVLPAADCPAGTRPALGQTTCVPVGWTDCQPPFVADPGGWGCLDQAPATACTGATRATLDGRGCVPIGDCSAPFPPAGATYFVNGAFTDPELDEHHVRAPLEALAAARVGDIVAIYPGTYSAEVAMYPGVKVVGKCAAEVTLEKVTGSTQPGVLMFDGKSELSGVTLRGHLIGAAVVQAGQLELTDVLLEANEDLGVFAADAGSAITLVRSVVRSTIPSAGKISGWGVNVESGARVVLEESEIAENVGVGVFAQHRGSTVEVTDTLIRDTGSVSSGTYGHGVHLEGGGAAHLQRSVVTGSHILGVYVTGSSSELVAEQSVLRDTLPSPTGGFGIGAQVDTGAHLQLSEVSITRSHLMGLLAFDARTQVDLDRVTFYRNPAVPLPGGSRAVMMQLGPTGTFADLAVVESAEAGIVIGGTGASATIDGLLVKDTKATSLGESGTGLWIADAGQATVTDAAILGNRARGVLVQENQATGVFEAMIVEGTVASSPTAGPNDGGLPIGLDAADGGNATCRRCLVRDNQHIAVRVSQALGGTAPGTLVFEDGVISDHEGDPVTEDAGIGLIVYLSASATVARTTLARNGSVGILVSSEGAQASLTEVTVKDTDLGREPEGHGVAVQAGAVLSATSLASIHNDGMGLWAQGIGTRVILTESLFGFPVGERPYLGVAAQDAANLELTRSEVNSGVIGGVASAFPDTAVFIDQSLIRNSVSHPSDPSQIADGILTWSRARTTVNRSVVMGNEGIGVGVVTAMARLNFVEVRDNTIGIHVTGGTRLETGSTAPADYVEDTAFVTDNCSFIGNATRTGTGAVAVPEMASIPVDPG